MKTAITLLELLVVIALVGIIAGVGWPNLVDWNCRQELRNDFEKFSLYLNEVQSEAIRRNKTTLVRVVTPQGSAYLRPFLLQDKNCTITTRSQSLENQIPIHSFPPATRISSAGYQCFYADGSANANSYQFTRKCSDKSYLYKIQIFGATGLFEKQKYNYTTKTWSDL